MREMSIGKSIKGISWTRCSKEYTQPISKLSPVEFDEHHELMSHMNESSQ